MFKKHFYIIILLSFSTIGMYAQENVLPKKLSGTYIGYTYQEIDEKKVVCKTQIKIKAHKDFSIQGTSTFYSENDSTQIMVIFHFDGNYEVKSQVVHVLENKILENPTQDKFLFKEISLTFKKDTKNIHLIGTWQSQKYPNLFGEMKLKKKK